MMTAGPESNFFLESDRHRRSLWAAVFAGLFAALSVAILVCRSPQTSMSQMVVVLLAGAYLTGTAIFGTTGSYLYWLRSYARPAPGLIELLQSTIRGWYWIPAVVLLFRKDSIYAPAVAAAGAAVLAFSLRREGPAALTLDPAPSTDACNELFAQTLRTTRAEWSGPIVAICVYAEVLVLLHGWLFLGCAILALAAFTFAWARTPAVRAHRFRVKISSIKISYIDLRQARSAIPALVVTILAMLAGAGHDLHLWGMGRGHGVSNDLPRIQTPPVHNSLGGHVSIILLTPPREQQILAPLPTEPLLAGKRLNKPMVIQFDGEYWYFQPPDSGPGPNAFVAHESPLIANVHSVLQIPLLMQAHQRLGTPLPLTCCHAIEVEIENRDQNPGTLDLGMSLSSSTAPGKSVLLGMQHVQSSEGDLWRTHTTPAHETLRFTLPADFQSDQIRQFDQIDMLIFPSPSRLQNGAKIAVRTLRLVP